MMPHERGAMLNRLMSLGRPELAAAGKNKDTKIQRGSERGQCSEHPTTTMVMCKVKVVWKFRNAIPVREKLMKHIG
jgi:hypothetical protein